ncbi:MAG: hypothetical protein ACP5OG_00175 [Candidatus Nanoarchaeia archaeon]
MNVLYKKNRTEKILIISIIGVLTIILAILTSILFGFNIVQNLVMSWILTTAYSLFAFLFIEPAKISVSKIIEKRVVQKIPVYTQIPIENKTIEVVEKPVIKEVPVQIPIENKTIEVVEKPVYIDRPVYIQKPRKKLVIPKYKYVASLKTKKYHTRFCRLGKLVKKKYKLQNNSKAFFLKKRFKACKSCIKK